MHMRLHVGGSIPLAPVGMEDSEGDSNWIQIERDREMRENKRQEKKKHEKIKLN